MAKFAGPHEHMCRGTCHDTWKSLSQRVSTHIPNLTRSVQPFPNYRPGNFSNSKMGHAQAPALRLPASNSSKGLN